MFLEDLKKIKDNDLLTRFSMVVQKEREATVTVVSYLSEIERRKLYLEEAYSSLFSFVTQKFHYSEGAAYRRIQASKVSQLYPEVLGLLANGKVSLMTVSLIEPHLTREKGKEWIGKIIEKSKREVEFMLSELSLKKESHRDVIRRLPVFSTKKKEGVEIVDMERQEKLPAPDKGGEQFLLPSAASATAQNHTTTGESSRGFTSETSIESAQKVSPQMKEEVRKIKIEFVAKEELAQKIERAKEILRHKFPEGRFEDIFNQALEDMLEKRDPERKPQAASVRSPQAASLRSNERVNKKNERASLNGEQMKEDDLQSPQSKDKSPKKVGSEKESEPGRKEENEVKGEKPPLSNIMNRYIPQGTRKKIWVRDGGRCSYKSPDGRRCGERNFIQIDHVQPLALRGESSEENLRLLCARHNQWRAEKTFGKWG